MANQDFRLYRFFEFLENKPHANVAPLGRIPGKINLNTVWDKFNFQGSLWDPHSWGRTPGPVPGKDDRPFKGFAAGTYPPGADGIPSSGAY